MTEKIIIENAFHLCQRLEQENKELKSALEEIRDDINVKIECLQYEIEHDCFSEIRCKALKEQIEFLDKINEVLNEK